ncbi:unnamed protein product [Rotaria sordida]|uniref:Uncharacterized protein n=1 Tax=Rotaria sordida TaxID=392033 RepID=A0A814RCQ9_9BILA|nr:unnamed protein product [Rotaria sordida]
MASSSSRRSSVSCADSGVSCSTTATTVNPRYECYWLDSCRGQHELDNCPVRLRELRGKLGIYYSPNAIYKRFTRDQMNDLPLESNPTGCTMIHLLIHKKENNETWLLFVTKFVKEKRQENEVRPSRQLLLTLPSSNPCKKNELQKDVAERALNSITHESEITTNIRSRLKRFLFVNASAIYPLYLPNEHADLLTTHFSPNEEVISLHWYPLSTILNQLPQWDNYLKSQAEGRELAQIRHPSHTGIKLNTGNNEHTIWSVTAACLMCIRNHVGFDTFLQP